MCGKVLYLFISFTLQLSLFSVPIANGYFDGIIEPNRLETVQPSGKYGMESGAHYASSVNIQGLAEVSDVSSCLDIVNNVLDTLPSEHSMAVENLSLVFDEVAKRGQGGGNTVKVRCVNVSEDELVSVLIHEVGHVVDTGLIDANDGSDSTFTDGDYPVSSDDKSVDFYSVSWIANNEFQDSTSSYSFVSEYAMTDPFEDFAESYLYYVLHGESFRRLALVNSQIDAKYDFLRDYVFDGVEYGGFDWYTAPLFDRPYDSTLLPYDLEGFLE
jgi:hypothetical protein